MQPRSVVIALYLWSVNEREKPTSPRITYFILARIPLCEGEIMVEGIITNVRSHDWKLQVTIQYSSMQSNTKICYLQLIFR